MSVAETERRQKFDFRFHIGNGFANEILAGDAKMHDARRELRDNVGGGQKRDLDIVQARQGSAIVAGTVQEFEPCACEKSRGVFLQPSFGGYREHERVAARPHGPAPARLRRPIQIAAPTAAMGFSAPSACGSWS